jgi:hypothetical protein
MAYLGKITPEQLEKLDPNNTLLRPQVTFGKKPASSSQSPSAPKDEAQANPPSEPSTPTEK